VPVVVVVVVHVLFPTSPWKKNKRKNKKKRQQKKKKPEPACLQSTFAPSTMKPSLPLWHPARAGVSAFGASPFVQGPVRAAALVCVRDAERKRMKKKFMRGWRSSVNKVRISEGMPTD
jgi:hypothetical protein